MRTFKNAMYTPPGGKWFFEIPETKAYFESVSSRHELEYKVAAHYRANKFEVPKNLWELIQDYMCLHLPEGYCSGAPVEGVRQRYLSFFQILESTEKTLRGATMCVTRTEAERRAAICKACPANSLRLCTSCNGLRKTGSGLVGGRKTKFDPYLGVCEYTGCVLVGQIHLGEEWLAQRVLARIQSAGEELPAPCWMKIKTV